MSDAESPSPREDHAVPAWYCLRTQTKREHLAAASLRQVEGIEVVCPRLRYKKVTRRGKIWWVEPLFPGYLLARFALAEIERQWALQTTRKALTIAKRRGRGGGRPPALNTEQRQSAIKLYHDGKHSVKEICQIMGISRATFYRYLSFANAKLKATSLVRDDINLFELDS